MAITIIHLNYPVKPFIFLSTIAEEIFDLLDRREYNSAMILTSNRNIDEWAEMLPDPVLANATIDRIFDRAELFLFQGSSYRLKGKVKISEIDKVEK